MNPFEMIVIIVFLAIAASVINNLIRAIASRDGTKASGKDAAREADELRAQILTLEDRIRVLERIVTEPSGREDLRRQFRDLEEH